MIETLWNKHFSYSLKENQAYMTKTSFASALMEYHNSNPLDAEVVANIVDIRKMALEELKHPDTISDINNNKITRSELWRSAFIVGGIAVKELK